LKNFKNKNRKWGGIKYNNCSKSQILGFPGIYYYRIKKFQQVYAISSGK